MVSVSKPRAVQKARYFSRCASWERIQPKRRIRFRSGAGGLVDLKGDSGGWRIWESAGSAARKSMVGGREVAKGARRMMEFMAWVSGDFRYKRERNGRESGK